jgi:hypothetical protein
MKEYPILPADAGIAWTPVDEMRRHRKPDPSRK